MTELVIWTSWALLALAAVMSAAATVRLPAGWARACEFPRVQIMLASIAAAAALVLTSSNWTWTIVAGIVLAALTTAQQLRHILPYTRLWQKQSADTGSAAESTLKVLVSNVLQTNTRYAMLADQIKLHQPDMVVVMEVDDVWIAALREATDPFPYKVEVPLNNKYGIALYSKLKIDEDCVTYLVRQDVPSLITTCQLATGRTVRFIALHPEPPMPHEGSVERDAEIVLAGVIAAQEPFPAIVTGDLNDVAWSHTTRRFRRISGLLDPRIGRGMYNTFHASIPILRWPLDHLFHDPVFAVKSMHRLPHVGSDHFPIMFELALLPEDMDVDTTPDTTKKSDTEEADELLNAVPGVNAEKIRNTGTHKVL